MQIDLSQYETREERKPREVRVPFMREAQGLGDLIARATGAVGVKPCTPCKKRQEELNRRVLFTPWG